MFNKLIKWLSKCIAKIKKLWTIKLKKKKKKIFIIYEREKLN